MRHYINIIAYDHRGTSGNVFCEYDRIPMTFYDFRQRLGKNDGIDSLDSMVGEYAVEQVRGNVDKTDTAFEKAERQAAQNRQIQTYLRLSDGKTASWSVMKNGQWKPMEDSVYEKNAVHAKKYSRKQLLEAIRYWKAQLRKLG